MTDDLSSDSDQRRPGPLARLFDLADAFIDGVHRRLTPVERLPAAVGAVLFAILATTPFWFHHEAEYKSDDILLIARGVETGIWEGLWRNLSRPFCDTWTIEFYRPLFTWTFCLEGNLFGDRPWAYFWVNVVWQALTVGAGYLVLRRMIGARFAALSSLLFVVNPWVANNVNWLVGRCTVTATFFVFCCVLLYLRHVDRKGDRRLEGLFKQLPWAAFGLAFVGVFYRETALFAVVLIFLLDLGEGRRDWRAFRDWCFLTLPFLVYLGVKYLVLGTLVGGYARLAAMQGEPPEGAQGLAFLGQYGNALLDLFMPGDGALSGGFDDGLRRWVGFGFLAILIVMCANRRVWRRPMTWVLLAFIVLHISPLLVVDQDVHGGTAQRWYTVMWAIAGLYGAWAAHCRYPNLASAAVLGLVCISGFNLHDNLEDYDVSSKFSRRVRERIREAGDKTVFVYNVLPYDQASAFYAVGLGQTSLPPFDDGTKAVYPVMLSARYGPDVTDQTPIAPWLLNRGESISVLWMDIIEREVHFLLPQHLKPGYDRFMAIPRMDLVLSRDGIPVPPEERVLREVDQLEVSIDAAALSRIDVHVICPLAELFFPRYRGMDYWTATFEGDRFQEDLREMLESTTLLDGAAKGRCWLWFVGYDRNSDPKRLEVAQVSDFYELHVTIPQARPEKRP